MVSLVTLFCGIVVAYYKSYKIEIELNKGTKLRVIRDVQTYGNFEFSAKLKVTKNIIKFFFTECEK